MSRTFIALCIFLCAFINPLHAEDTPGSQAELLGSFDLPGSAVSWIFDNDTAYIFLEGPQLVSFDVSNPTAPELLDSITLPDFAYWEFAKIIDNRLYIFEHNVFFIIDIDDPTNMNYLDYHKTSTGNIVSAALYEHYLYLGSEVLSTEIYDISDPSAPELLSTLHDTDSLLAAVNGIGYSTRGQALDLTDPLNPAPIGNAPLNARYNIFHLDYNILYLFGDGSASVDISEPLNPQRISTNLGLYFSNPGPYANNGSIFFSHPFREHNIRITDLSQPSAPYSLEEEVGLPGVTQLNTIRTIDGLLLALTPDTIEVFQLHTTPIVGSHHTSGFANDIMIIDDNDNKIAILANDGGALQFFNINNSNNPILLNTFLLSGNAFAIDRKDSVLYVATERDNLNLVDISDIMNPTLIMNIDTGRRARDVLVRNNLLYVVDRIFGLSIFDITTPNTPQLLSTTDTPGRATDIVINQAGTTAYISQGQQDIQILDITAPASPSIIGTIGDFNDTDKLTLAGDYLYVTDGNSGYHIIDISDPSDPEHILQMDDFDVLKGGTDPGFAHEIQLHGDFLYLANGTGGFVSIYNANPLNPIPNQWIRSRFANGGSPSTRRFIVKDGLAFTAVHDAGLRIYDLADLSICPIDLNRDYNLDSFDISYFLDALVEHESIADLNGDGKYDFFDVSIFFNFFAHGCP